MHMQTAQLIQSAAESVPVLEPQNAPAPGSAPRPPADAPAAPVAADPRAAMLRQVLDVMKHAGIPCWIIDGFGEASFDPCDVDCLVPAEALPGRLAQVLHDAADRIGGDIVRWRDDHHAVIASRVTQPNGTPYFLNLHFRADFRRVGRYFYAGPEVLAGRRAGATDADAWTPSNAMEFACYLIEKVAKQCLDADRGRPLEDAYRRDPAGCDAQVRRFWGAADASLIGDAARTGNWSAVQRALPRLRASLRRRAALRRPVWTGAYFLHKVWLKGVRRRWRPHSGLHVVLLGPDGVGKTTIQDAILHNARWSFTEVCGRSFAPPPWRKPRTSLGKPHGKPPRSLPASLAKAAYWFAYYTVGYYFTVYPAVARGALYVNHRYIMDTLVDAKRYRYRGPRWILRLIWWAAPKPDLVLLLDAPPEVVQARKREVPFEETARACAAYRTLVEPMPNGRIIDANRPVAEVVEAVARTILRLRTTRVVRRLGLE